MTYPFTTIAYVLRDHPDGMIGNFETSVQGSTHMAKAGAYPSKKGGKGSKGTKGGKMKGGRPC